VAAAPMEGGLENWNAAEPPRIGDDLVGQDAFKSVVRIERHHQAGAKRVVVARIFVRKNDEFTSESVFQGVRCYSGLAD
jgi:hypothetical protein